MSRFISLFLKWCSKRETAYVSQWSTYRWPPLPESVKDEKSEVAYYRAMEMAFAPWDGCFPRRDGGRR